MAVRSRRFRERQSRRRYEIKSTEQGERYGRASIFGGKTKSDISVYSGRAIYIRKRKSVVHFEDAGLLRPKTISSTISLLLT